ncbi:hypothetical protein [Glycomyces algeriensis]|uniref:Uncharacterized protein n=1 Tax=Glycomyces algeriensis TaxID=256037 RepID=A0A9W6LFP2_9ACTN|nr:hypothetical protein [Glycomyces algeriensis]MDA1367514.1 hypothetical protein [Glycomyces algeriensis]MDR7353123.1 hypothetical protein [Glycomyces algeriensis]GLI40816.1 hypothetical protein GALLR39Z86_06660 [Glycomyces algeriensis]
MSISYNLYISAIPLEDLSEHLASKLNLSPVHAESPAPLKNDEWWCNLVHQSRNPHTESDSVRLEVDRYVAVVFEPGKFIGWEHHFRGLSLILDATRILLDQNPQSSAFFDFNYETVVLEKKKYQSLIVDPRLVDSNDLDKDGVFAKMFSAYVKVPLAQPE